MPAAPPSRSASPGSPSRRPPAPAPPSPSPWWYALLIVPFVGMLWVPFYNSVEPRLDGVPFFYWYQFAFIAVSAALTAVVYFATSDGT